MWNNENPVSEYVEVPRWIDQDITVSDVAAREYACASGAYMPSVEYATALNIMNEHGDEIMDFLDETIGSGEILQGAVQEDVSWAGLAVRFVSAAVELWAVQVQDELEEMED